MPTLSHLLAFCVASLVLVAVPGPAIAYLVTRALADGRRGGLASVLGVEAGTLVHVAAAAIGLSALVASQPGALLVLRWAGVAYLLWMALQAFRSRGAASPGVERPATTARQAFWQGLTVEVLNPKTALFFVAFLPQFVDPAHGSAATQILVLGGAFVLIAGVCDTAWVLGATLARRRLRVKADGALRSTTALVYVALATVAAAL
jgi:threonine/homoserine/homoserine lactone efflux protein